MSEHTPGPWSVYDVTCILGSRGESIAKAFDCETVGFTREMKEAEYHSKKLHEAAANARLIAAAPDLLAAAEAALVVLRPWAEHPEVEEAIRKLEAAILAAKERP